ncbi:MAG: GGDEF and EAL domain-containing protein [Oscillospiraceae bacterium]|nr:GGDEF and EAL domain-containing protein [Oscillospiraceae bacterium]
MAASFDFNKNELIEAVSRRTNDYVVIHDFSTGLTKIPEEMKTTFGFSTDTPKGFFETWMKLMHDEDIENINISSNNIKRGISDTHDVEYRVRDKVGGWVHFRERGEVIRDGMGKPSLYFGTISNIGRKDHIDSITGLPKKREFESRIKLCIAEKKQFGIMILNIDNFKNINALYGRDFGDMALRSIGQSIVKCLPNKCSAYRLDSDEFGIIFVDALKSDIKQVFTNINNRTSDQHEYNGHKYYCTVSAGCCKYNEESAGSFDMLVANSHSALDIAKAKGKARVIFHDPKLTEIRSRELHMTELLHDSIKHNFRGFEVHCQPQVYADSGFIKGGEALLRWKCDEYGPVSPVEFIPILEKTGMIAPVGKWVFDESVRICAKCIKYNPDFKMSINVSYVQLLDDSFLSFIDKSMHRHGVLAKNIIVEFTESCFIEERGIVFEAFENIRQKGIKIAMDDFGTGYSSLEVLKEVPADIVKIDRAFVKNIRTSNFDRTFIKFVVELCHDVGIEVCLEGVEREEEYKIVLPMRIDFIQGYLFGKPLDENTFSEKFLNVS